VAAGDHTLRRWAVVTLCWRLILRAEYGAARALVDPLLEHERHPDLLTVAARVASGTGDWRTARQLADEERLARAAEGDRAGERASGHVASAGHDRLERRELRRRTRIRPPEKFCTLAERTRPPHYRQNRHAGKNRQML
jgi:hypothetical protein